MKIAIFGAGYVGLVTGVCFAEMGNHVVGIDVDQTKIDLLNQGKSPIFETGLEALLQKNLALETLQFTTDAEAAIHDAAVIIIAVGTPPLHDGSVDLSYIDSVAKIIGQHLNDYKVIVNKSTVPVGTAERVQEMIQAFLDARRVKVHFDVVSNPEFLKEGLAVSDCMKPDRIIIGTDSDRAFEIMKNLYAPFNRNHDRMMRMNVRSAELTKYAANAMLATKISFINEMSRLAEKLGADIEEVRVGIGADHRIGYHFIYPGCGYGGSCFPKDVQGLIDTARQNQYEPKILKAVHEVNETQKRVLFEKIEKHFNKQLQGKTFALWGLAFKPNTDDIREASSRVLMEALWNEGAKVRAYDPQAMKNIAEVYGKRDDLMLRESKEDALEGADALVIVTEWSQFRAPDFEEVKQLLKAPVIFDGRNLFEPEMVRELGFVYYSIGRG